MQKFMCALKINSHPRIEIKIAFKLRKYFFFIEK